MLLFRTSAPEVRQLFGEAKERLLCWQDESRDAARLCRRLETSPRGLPDPPGHGSFFFMSSELEELYQEVILDHPRRPRNFGELADASVVVQGDNPACGDEIHLSVKFGDNGTLRELRFTGHGCAISQASASMMTEKLERENSRRRAGDAARVSSDSAGAGLGAVHKAPSKREHPIACDIHSALHR
jgi:hypothetical protein